MLSYIVYLIVLRSLVLVIRVGAMTSRKEKAWLGKPVLYIFTPDGPLQKHRCPHTHKHKVVTINGFTSHMSTRRHTPRAGKPHNLARSTRAPTNPGCTVSLLFSRDHTNTHHKQQRVACILAVARVALAVGAAAAAMAGLTGLGGLLKLGLSRRNAEDHGGGLLGAAALLCQVRVHLAAGAV